MRCIYLVFLFLAITAAAGVSASAQETQERVIDEVVAQVNEGVITLSRIKRESKVIIDEAIRSGKSKEEAQKMVDEKQGELIANLINEELLIQKAKELNLDAEVEARVNDRFVQIMKQYDMKTVDALYKEMERQGVDPAEIREGWKRQETRDLVMQREVQSREYWRPNGRELREYYEKNKDKFTKPETVTLSEIFLGFAGRDEAAVREKAKDLLTQLKGGADFEKLVAENSDRPDAAKTKGRVDKFNVKELDEKFANAIKGVKAGGYGGPVEVPDVGISVLRVDERTEASNESVFDENAVRMAILGERAPNAIKEFMATLRKNSYIKIGEAYRPLVSPVLFAEERKEKTTSN